MTFRHMALKVSIDDDLPNGTNSIVRCETTDGEQVATCYVDKSGYYRIVGSGKFLEEAEWGRA